MNGQRRLRDPREPKLEQLIGLVHEMHVERVIQSLVAVKDMSERVLEVQADGNMTAASKVCDPDLPQLPFVCFIQIY